MHVDDTIVAISTPPGRGGLGVVRLSGPESLRIATELVRSSDGARLTLHAGRALFATLVDRATGERIDEVVVTHFAKPHSYTTDDVVEISAHGAPVVLRHIVNEAVSLGARVAEPGEFTMRAFLNKRLDLTQAEAVGDLIQAQTVHQAKAAAQQLNGSLSKRLQPIKKLLVNLIATLEAGVDFAEDDISVLPDAEILKRTLQIKTPLQQLAESFAYGKMVHEGLTLAIVGRPNVGKSSLFNRLVERERAIVTASPGTTRDLVSETVTLDGVLLRLVDTAGIRSATNEAEKIGIERSREALAEADIALVVLDATDTGAADEDLISSAKEAGGNVIVVQNKCDLSPAKVSDERMSTSALTGEGIAQLRREIIRRTGADSNAAREPGFLTNTRQKGLVDEAVRGLLAAEVAVNNHIPHEMLLLDMYSALRPLDAITGETSTEDILHLIFGSFCIGK